jgi:hypothetical protein
MVSSANSLAIVFDSSLFLGNLLIFTKHDDIEETTVCPALLRLPITIFACLIALLSQLAFSNR